MICQEPTQCLYAETKLAKPKTQPRIVKFSTAIPEKFVPETSRMTPAMRKTGTQTQELQG